MKKYISLITLLLLVMAPTTLAVSRTFTIDDSDAVDGDILVYVNGKIERAKEPFSKDLFGVLESNPLLVQQTSEGQPITSTGVANVNVVSTTGAIKAGDAITSSTTAGKGQKADKPGFILGKALTDLEGDSGQIPVAIQITNTSDSTKANLTTGAGAVLNTIDVLLQKNLQTKEGSFKFIQYVLAALVFIASISFAFINFSRSIPKGIEAIGRNPLAKTSIQASIGLNALLSVIITLAGIVSTVLILRL